MENEKTPEEVVADLQAQAKKNADEMAMKDKQLQDKDAELEKTKKQNQTLWKSLNSNKVVTVREEESLDPKDFEWKID